MSKGIKGYEDLYEITKTGRIISLRQQRPMTRCGDEYGFHIVKLTKEGSSTNHNVFNLWQQAFPELNHSEFRGALKIKYGKACKLITGSDIHF
ncbi:NUMOD4 domain-containing protein [Pseudobacillus badius]|uniref:NUMOD4 domain-containing protein n=1 Tax=Bacillus badius TaxID=1455 RepID=UPI000ABE7031|nr:NUMOD4 domain-containing protein [Bacillus badius]